MNGLRKQGLAASAVLLAFVALAAQARAQVSIPNFYENRGLIGAAQAIHRADSGIRVLHIGAHPDDEDSALLAYLSLGRGVRVTYLSLTRGEGGQNLIGPELFEDLGVIRTSELLAARREDGARQLFGRMIDFGFSKNPEECFRFWDHEKVLEDVVRAIRLTRPHVVLSRFSGTPKDGHGQHQVAGIAAREAIAAAADPARFPDQIKQGLAAWKVEKFYSGAFTAEAGTTLEVKTNVYDPWVGRSLGSIGYKGRSMHRSQDMGMIEYEDSRPAFLRLEIPAGAGPERDLFDGLTLKSGSAALLPAIPTATDLERRLATLRTEDSADPETLVDLESSLASLLGIRLEAFATDAMVTSGGKVQASCRAYIPEGSAPGKARWTIETGPGLSSAPSPVVDATKSDADFTISAKDSAIPSLPYYLREPNDGFLYRWPDDAKTEGQPFESPVAVAVFAAEFEGTPFTLRIPVEYRRADPAYGEIREDLAILPGASVAFDPPTLAVRAESRIPKLGIQIGNLRSEKFEGTLELFETGANAGVVAVLPVSVDGRSNTHLDLNLDGTKIRHGRNVLAARWRSSAGDPQLAYGVKHLDYRHIRPRYLCRPAELHVDSLDVKLPEKLRIGYVNGSGDGVAQVLAQLGVEVTFLDSGALAQGDLSGFDAIVLGIRAYEVRPDLVAHNSRLLDYVKAGGTLVSQYNKSLPAAATPYPIKFRQPIAERVTDESARVTIVAADHPAFHFPNPIGANDFEGWIQERGLYFWTTWDEHYTPLIACADPGEPPQKGGMMYAPLGKGHYVYTSYAFFRQMPAGVEGAIKLFVNLISLGRAEKK